jgi:uncharacterized DUF497 family protein
MALRFEWDARKAASNLKKHGVSFDEAVSVFDDPLAAIFDDQEHSEGERREIIVGYSVVRRLLLVSFTDRRNRVRVISARTATRKERQRHEEFLQS